MTARQQHYPYQAPIDAYGDGGFRFADMSHRGGLLLLPSGIWGWEANEPADIGLDLLVRVQAETVPIEVVLLGTGATQVFPPLELRRAFEAAGLGLEPMSTGAAARTWNILLAEKRAVAAALLPVA